MYVAPLVEEIVSTPQDVMKLLSKGNESRKIGATDWVRIVAQTRLTPRTSAPLDLTAYSPLSSRADREMETATRTFASAGST